MSAFVSRPLDIYRALGDATRLRTLQLVRRMELSVGELAQVLGQSQPRVSRHVKILCDAGLLARDPLAVPPAGLDDAPPGFRD